MKYIITNLMNLKLFKLQLFIFIMFEWQKFVQGNIFSIKDESQYFRKIASRKKVQQWKLLIFMHMFICIPMRIFIQTHIFYFKIGEKVLESERSPIA